MIPSFEGKSQNCFHRNYFALFKKALFAVDTIRECFESDEKLRVTNPDICCFKHLDYLCVIMMYYDVAYIAFTFA
jgi:hypothetical protein